MSRAKGVLKENLFLWVAEAIENESFKKCQISFDGISEKCDGYIGEIVFVKVTGSTTENKEKTLNLVVKHSKQNDFLRSSAFNLMFRTEIHFYEKIYPLFQKFQLEKNIPEIFNAAPKCFKTIYLNKKEVLVFENLKVQGYEMYDRTKPLNIFHMKAVLQQFAKFHALSFALRDQKKADFEAVLENCPNFMGTFLIHELSKGSFKKAVDNGLKALLNNGEMELMEKFKKFLEEQGGDPSDIMAKLVDAHEPQSVVVHGDGWSNNFLFKYKGNNKNSPCDVAILDWQGAYLRSPAIDLAYFFYSTASAQELKHFEILMRIYYESFAKFLTSLGSNPEELFPFNDLRKHWRKYSTYGLLFSPLLLAFVLCNKEDAPAFEDLQDEKGFEDMLIIDTSKNKLYAQRFRDVVQHHFQCTF